MKNESSNMQNAHSLVRFFLPPKIVLPQAGDFANGELRPASAGTGVVLEWMRAFYKEALFADFDKDTGNTFPLFEKSGTKTLTGNCCGMAASDEPPEEIVAEPPTLYIWHNEQPVAMGMLTQSEHECRINLIYVPPHFRGRGYGRAVVAALAKKARTGGRLPVLRTSGGNVAAIAIYRSLGFEVAK